MTTPDSMLTIFRTKVDEARRLGGRQNLVSFQWQYPDYWSRMTNLRVLTVDQSLHPEARGDANGALTQLFRDETSLQVSPTQLVDAVYRNPKRVRREQYYDLKEDEVSGRDGVRLGVEIRMDDQGELSRTFYARGPWLGQRIKQNFQRYLKDSKKLLPPAAEL